MENYYVYLILDPSEDYFLSTDDISIDKKPFYVGYGKNNRIEQHLMKREMDRKCFKSCKIKSIINDNKSPIFISNAKKGEGNAFYGKKHNLDSFKTCKVTLQIDVETGKVISRFNSVTEAERETGIKHIYRVCNGSRKSAGGFKWIYEDKKQNNL